MATLGVSLSSDIEFGDCLALAMDIDLNLICFTMFKQIGDSPWARDFSGTGHGVARLAREAARLASRCEICQRSPRLA